MELGGTDPFYHFGVAPDASMDEIRRRYHELALAYHPDRHGGNDPRQAKKFVAVRATYEAVLQARQTAERGQRYGPCRVCGALRSLVPRLDGARVCEGCLFGRTSNRLPQSPPAVALKCSFSVAW